MADYYTQYSFEIPNLTSEEEKWLREGIDQRSDDDYYPTLPDCEFQIESDGSHSLWLHDDASGSELDVLAEFLQDFLGEFRLDQYIAFSWAETCSKPRTGAFGGGALFITSEDVL